jgi:hypothetical protein
MKRIILLAAIFFTAKAAEAQYQKQPIIIDDAPTIFNNAPQPYQEYADQGSRMYINNSQFYNKDNTFQNAIPTGNGLYVTPGNSNPINQDMHQGPAAPSGTIYSGYIPVRDYGNSSIGRDGTYR